MPDSRFQDVRLAIYNLKRRSGQVVDVYYPSAESTDLDDGSLGTTYVVKRVRRAVVLPFLGERKFSYDLAFIAANRNVTYGGFYDHHKRSILIDRRDLGSSFVLDISCSVIFDGKRWEIKDIVEFENREAVILNVIALLGAPKNEEIRVKTRTEVGEEDVLS